MKPRTPSLLVIRRRLTLAREACARANVHVARGAAIARRG